MKLFNIDRILRDEPIKGDIPPTRKLLSNAVSMAWPAVLESFFVALVGFIDTVMVSSLGSYAIAAVGLTQQPKFVFLCVFWALCTGISALVARRRGENDRESAVHILRTSLIIGLVLTAVCTVVSVSFADTIIKLAGSEPDTHKAAVDYFVINMTGLVFTSVMLIINAAQRGAGNTKIAMLTNTVSNLVNMVLNYLLIGGNLGCPKLGTDGAAIATVIGAAVGCGMSVASLFNKKSFVCIFGIKGLIVNDTDAKSLFGVSLSSFIEQICLRIGFLLFAITAAKLGTQQYAAHQIGMNMLSLSFSFGDGFSIAAVALIGRSLGECRRDLAKLYSAVCLRLGFLCAFVLSVIFLLFGRQLYGLFSDEKDILDMGVIIMRIMCAVIYMQIMQVIFFGCLRGAGDTKYTAAASFISVTVVRPLLGWLFCYPLGLGLIGAWMGLALDQFMRFILGYTRFRHGDWLYIRL